MTTVTSDEGRVKIDPSQYTIYCNRDTAKFDGMDQVEVILMKEDQGAEQLQSHDGKPIIILCRGNLETVHKDIRETFCCCWVHEQGFDVNNTNALEHLRHPGVETFADAVYASLRYARAVEFVVQFNEFRRVLREPQAPFSSENIVVALTGGSALAKGHSEIATRLGYLLILLQKIGTDSPDGKMNTDGLLLNGDRALMSSGRAVLSPTASFHVYSLDPILTFFPSGGSDVLINHLSQEATQSSVQAPFVLISPNPETTVPPAFSRCCVCIVDANRATAGSPIDRPVVRNLPEAIDATLKHARAMDLVVQLDEMTKTTSPTAEEILSALVLGVDLDTKYRDCCTRLRYMDILGGHIDANYDQLVQNVE